MIKAILFDLGDTVIYNDWKSRNEAVMSETGVEIIRTPEIKKLNEEISIGKKKMKDLFQKVISDNKLNIDVEKVVNSYIKNYTKYSPVNEKMLKLVEQLKKKVKVYALSNTNDLHKIVNAKRGVYAHFHESFLSCDLGMKKPNARIFEFVLKKIKCSPEEVLLIDDDSSNIDMADKIGIKTILYKDYGLLVNHLKNFNLL